MAASAEERLLIMLALPPELRALLNEGALSSDVVELVFAILHSRLGSQLDLRTLLGSLETVSFAAALAALPEEQRGWRMAPTSK
jgi:hypothetical protein